MPASPSLLSEQNKWKRPRTGNEDPPRQRTEDDDEDDDDEFDPEDDDDRATTDHDQSAITARETEVLLEGGVRISDFPVAIRHNVNRPHSSVLRMVELERSLHGEDANRHTCPILLENLSYGQLQALSSDGGTGAHAVMTPRQSGILKNFCNSRPHVLPLHSNWFSRTGVHRLERQVVPHFFSGKCHDRTPDKYVRCRNEMISVYLENPERVVSIADYGRLLDEEVISPEDLTRIFRFLHNWGIINYCSSSTADRRQCNLKEDASGDLQVPSTALKFIDSLIEFDTPKCGPRAAEDAPCSDGSDLDSRIRERLSDYHCSHCRRPAPCVNYQSQKQCHVLLCTDCFHEGRFVWGHSSMDFARVDLSNELMNMDGESWSDAETLLLLEAVEKHRDRWNEIAEHVGTKSKSQCILHFLRLPMGGDGRFENIQVLPRSWPESCCRLPFANSKNPVMSLVAFLASALGPRVAAACAHASLVVLSEDDPGSPLSDEKIKAATEAGLTAAAIKAKLFSEHEERDIQRLSANIINQQLKRLELKLKHFAEVETMLMKECEQVERARHRFAAERVRLISTRFAPGRTNQQPSPDHAMHHHPHVSMSGVGT